MPLPAASSTEIFHLCAHVAEGVEITILLALMHPIRELCAGLDQSAGPADPKRIKTNIQVTHTCVQKQAEGIFLACFELG